MSYPSLAERRPFFSWWRASLTAMFGLWIARPDQQTFQNTPAWDAFAGVAPEPFWGSLLLVIGLLHLLALGRRWVWLRAWMSLVAAILWGAFAFVFGTHMPTGLSWIIYLWLSFASLHDHLVLARWVPYWWPGSLD